MSVKKMSAAESGGVSKRFGNEEYGDYILMPGDPQRIDTMAGQWDQGAKKLDFHRGYRAAVGLYQGTKIAAVSTGMGGPNLESPLHDFAAKGVHTFIRVGTTGAIQEHVNMGDIIINDACVRLDGTSKQYVRDEFPAAASFEVTMALVQAAEKLGFRYHVGTGCTTASFFAGQSRSCFNGYNRPYAELEMRELQQAQVLNYDMEGSALFTLARIFGVRAGMCASVIAHRITGEYFDDGGIERACLVGAEAVHILTDWDSQKRVRGKQYYVPSFSVSE